MHGLRWLLATLLFSVACSPSEPPAPPPPPSVGAIAAQMNDVSILFPLPSSAADIDHLLAASSSGAMGTLLPAALYTGVGPIAGSSFTGNNPFGFAFADYSDLRVVAMRIDPCFASLAPDPHGVGCVAQIRLILQEVRATSGTVSAFDSALHVFYSLTRDQFLTLAAALVALRTANDNGVPLGPLAPHPIMARQGQGLSGAMSTGVRQLILQYAGAQNLMRVAQLDLANGILAWTLSAVTVTNAAAAITSPLGIPTLRVDGGVSTAQSITTGASLDPFSAQFTPITTSADNLTPLDSDAANTLSSSAQQSAFDALVRIENPKDNSPNTIDCGSCHLATPTEELVVKPLLALDDEKSALAFMPDGKSVSASDMTTTFSSPSARLDLHAFSYIDQSPTINQRVVNETAAVVEYLNRLP